MKPVYGRHFLERLAAMTPPQSPGAAFAPLEGDHAVAGSA